MLLVCSACGTRGDALLRCSACKEAWYCNAQCQSTHWPTHRTACFSSKRKVTPEATASSIINNTITNKTSDTAVAHPKQLDSPKYNISYPDSPITEPALSVAGLNSAAATTATTSTTTSIPNNEPIGTDSAVTTASLTSAGGALGSTSVHNAASSARNPENVQVLADEHLWDKSFEHVDGVAWEWVNRLDRKVRNVMVLLHGFGDKEASMAGMCSCIKQLLTTEKVPDG
jgi:hypothetical protein